MLCGLCQLMQIGPGILIRGFIRQKSVSNMVCKQRCSRAPRYPTLLDQASTGASARSAIYLRG